MIKLYKKFKKEWTKWCKKVEKHNEKQDYVTQEECWNPKIIFVPIIVAILFCSLVCYAYHLRIFSFISMFIGFCTGSYGLLYLNWKTND